GAGLDEAVARELAPRHAFTRACRKLEKDRVIRKISEDEDSITFQFTREQKQGNEFQYTREDVLGLAKKTGVVACHFSKALEAQPQEELDRAITTRTGADLGAIVQKLCEKEADLVPIRDAGGAYIVPGKRQEFLQKLYQFAKSVGGSLRRYPILGGTESG